MVPTDKRLTERKGDEEPPPVVGPDLSIVGIFDVFCRLPYLIVKCAELAGEQVPKAAAGAARVPLGGRP